METKDLIEMLAKGWFYCHCCRDEGWKPPEKLAFDSIWREKICLECRHVVHDYTTLEMFRELAQRTGGLAER